MIEILYGGKLYLLTHFEKNAGFHLTTLIKIAVIFFQPGIEILTVCAQWISMLQHKRIPTGRVVWNRNLYVSWVSGTPVVLLSKGMSIKLRKTTFNSEFVYIFMTFEHFALHFKQSRADLFWNSALFFGRIIVKIIFSVIFYISTIREIFQSL